VLESPAENAGVRPGFEIVGWVVDLGAGEGNGPGIEEVRVHMRECDGELFAETDEFEERPGAGVALGLDDSYDISGFRIDVDNAPRGPVPLAVCARSTLGEDIEANASVTVQMTRGVQLVVETPIERAMVGKDIVVRGWAIDLDASEEDGPGIDSVFIMPGHSCDVEPYSDTPLNIERPDVQEMFDLDDSFLESGFEFVLPLEADAGFFAISVCALSNETGELVSVTKSATVSTDIFMFVDAPLNGATVSSPFDVLAVSMDLGPPTMCTPAELPRGNTI
jgi:hypothetical protein